MKRLLISAPARRRHAACAEDAQPKTAEEILRIVRLSYALQNHKMNGHLATTPRARRAADSSRWRIRSCASFSRMSRRRSSTSTSTPRPPRFIRCGPAVPVVPNQYGETSVRGMEFNYEDLSLRFLYWPRPQLMGEGRVSRRSAGSCVSPIRKDGPYYVVDIWVHQGSGGAAKMEAYDFNSKVVKRYQVTKVQKGGQSHRAQGMKIETFNPFNGDVKGRTYMILENPVKK
jgi:hypothetical protein